MAKNITDLDSKNFDKFIKDDKIVVYFWATWCGPCKMMGPVFEETANELKDKTKFGKVDVDKQSELAQRFQVMSIPTLIFFRDGKQVDRTMGVTSKDELEKKLKEIK
ncbi:MAG: thioredoxin [Nanoarchaeota archaeon]|nr:thioredoxin [Nanoarchaeota archaeon]MBU1051406.1 thioredoxin [Nanoarchaeota archaeon]MBU1989021.1 thioredoxin [Nanoarchaeota archaeon]